MFKKALVFLLCGMMLIGMLAGCVNNEGPENSSVQNEDQTWISSDLEPNSALKDTTFNILSFNEMNVAPEENSSDPLEDALYYRDDMIQNHYDITINNLLDTDYTALSQKVKTDVSAGTGDYDLVYQHMVDAATSLGMQGNLYNLTDLDYVSFDNPWWDQDCKNGFMFGENMFVVTGDLLPNTMLVTGAVIFNKNLFDQRGWEYPYDDAREGTWTIDDMLEMTKDQTQDLNGDGKVTYSDDFFGMTGWALACDYNFYFGSGCTMFTFDDDHLPVYNANTDKLQIVYEKVYQLLETQQALHVTASELGSSPSVWGDIEGAFKTGRALFWAASLSDGNNLRDMDDDYGFLPHPKYDESQENYLGFVNGVACVACVPKSLSNSQLDITGYMMEALSSSSYYLVTDTLYSKVAKAKNARDPESAEMVDIIIRHKVFDFGYTHFMGLPCASIFQTSLDKNSASIIRDITSNERATMKKLKEAYEQYGYDFYE